MKTLVVQIFEQSIKSYPVVEHRFNGRTKKEAENYFKAHMQTDSFLRECVEGDNFQHQFSCSHRIFWARNGKNE